MNCYWKEKLNALEKYVSQYIKDEKYYWFIKNISPIGGIPGLFNLRGIRIINVSLLMKDLRHLPIDGILISESYISEDDVSKYKMSSKAEFDKNKENFNNLLERLMK